MHYFQQYIIKNTSDDYDIELVSMQKFADLCYGMQTVFVDMLFASKHKKFTLYKSAMFDRTFEAYKSLLSNKIEPFYAYAISQATRYSVKGDRLNALETAGSFVANLIQNGQAEAKLKDIDFTPICLKHPIFIRVEEGEDSRVYLDILGRKTIETATISYLENTLKPIRKTYGGRAEVFNIVTGKQIGRASCRERVLRLV